MRRRRILTAAVVATLVLGAPSLAAGEPPKPDEKSAEHRPGASDSATTSGGLHVVDLASRYTGSHPRYRIPALTTLPNGDLLAVYDGRPTMADLPSNIALLMRRSTDDGLTGSLSR